MRTSTAGIGEKIQKRLMQRARDGEGVRKALTRRLGKRGGLAVGGPVFGGGWGQVDNAGPLVESPRESLASDMESFQAEQRWRRGHRLTGMQEARIAEERAGLMGQQRLQQVADETPAPAPSVVSPAQREARRKARWDQTMKLGAALQAGRAKGSAIGKADFDAMDEARKGFDSLGKGALGKAAGGPVFDARDGGMVPPGPEGIDQVPAMTSAGEVMLDGPSEERAEGEYVLTPEMIEALGGVEKLEALREALAGEREEELAEREGEVEGYARGGDIARGLAEDDASWQMPLRTQREAAVAGAVPELDAKTVAPEYLNTVRAGAQAHQKRVEEEGGLAKVQRRVLAGIMAGAQLPVLERAREVRAEVERENAQRGPQSLRQTAPQANLAPVPLAEDDSLAERKMAHEMALAEKETEGKLAEIGARRDLVTAQIGMERERAAAELTNLREMNAAKLEMLRQQGASAAELAKAEMEARNAEYAAEAAHKERLAEIAERIENAKLERERRRLEEPEVEIETESFGKGDEPDMRTKIRGGQKFIPPAIQRRLSGEGAELVLPTYKDPGLAAAVSKLRILRNAGDPRYAAALAALKARLVADKANDDLKALESDPRLK